MGYKYAGEAVVLLGIAYSIFRWVARTLADDRREPRRRNIFGVTLPARRAETESAQPHRHTPVAGTVIEQAALAFGISPDQLSRMENHQREMLLSAFLERRRGGENTTP